MSHNTTHRRILAAPESPMNPTSRKPKPNPSATATATAKNYRHPQSLINPLPDPTTTPPSTIQNVSHRWPRPTPKISLKDFKILLRRRTRALSHIHSSSTTDVTKNFAMTSNLNPAPNPDCSNTGPSSIGDAVNDNGGGNHVDNTCTKPELVLNGDLKEGEAEKEVKEEEKATDERFADGEDPVRKLVGKNDALVEEVKNEESDNEVPTNPVVEKINTANATSDVDNRKKEVKEKLEILNEKKHSLVQVLKQILNAEEQLKRQNSSQGTSARPAVPQVDTTTDSGSMTRVNTPRMGSDGNPCADVEGGEADDVSNHHSRHLARMSSTSPSSDSQQRKPASNVIPHSYRTTLGVSISPSRFAPAGQGPPSVSVSGASYIASSPSPAASGGTSVFRDARLPSPWN